MSFPRYPKYKPSGVEWLGDVPAHWSVQKLKSIARFSGGGTPSRDTPAFWNGDIPWVSPKDMKVEDISEAEESITPAGVAASATKLVAPNHLLMVVRSGILQHTIPVAINSRAVALNQDMKALNFGPAKWMPKFFMRWIQGLNERLLLAWAKQGATVESIEHAYLADSLVPVPPDDEQAGIVVFLDAQIERIDALVAEQERLIELLKEKRQAVISHAVTKGLNPNAPMKDSGIEWLSTIPSHWRVVQVRHLARDSPRSFTDGDWIEAPFITDSGVRLIQTGNVGIGYYKEQGFRFISEQTFEELGCTEVFPGDVMVCRLDGPVGRACLAPDLGCRMITSVDNAVLKVRDDVLAEFIVATFSSVPWLSWIDALCRVGGGFRLRISRSQLGELRIPLPPLDEQRAIAEHLAAEGRRWSELEAAAAQLIEKLQERRAALISAAVTGQIDVRPEAHRTAA